MSSEQQGIRPDPRGVVWGKIRYNSRKHCKHFKYKLFQAKSYTYGRSVLITQCCECMSEIYKNNTMFWLNCSVCASLAKTEVPLHGMRENKLCLKGQSRQFDPPFSIALGRWWTEWCLPTLKNTGKTRAFSSHSIYFGKTIADIHGSIDTESTR